MSRALALACLCALPIAGLLRQAEAAESCAATRAELTRPGAIDPVDPPLDPLGDSILRATSPAETQTPGPPSDLDGLRPPPGLGPPSSLDHGHRGDVAGPAPPPTSARRRLCRLQVFRN